MFQVSSYFIDDEIPFCYMYGEIFLLVFFIIISHKWVAKKGQDYVYGEWEC